MKRYRIIYQFHHSRMGFQNSITIDSLNENMALDEAKRQVSEVYGSGMLKRFSFKLDTQNTK